jgi:transcriptional regulator with XRE-family HTH domain
MNTFGTALAYHIHSPKGQNMDGYTLSDIAAMEFDRHEFGQRLKVAREKNQMTQEQVADQLSVTKGMVSQYETGRSTPTYENLAKLAQLFHASVTWLLFGQQGGDHLMSREVYELWLHTSELPINMRKFVVLAIQMAGRADLPSSILAEPTPENWLDYAKSIYQSAKDRSEDDPTNH